MNKKHKIREGTAKKEAFIYTEKINSLVQSGGWICMDVSSQSSMTDTKGKSSSSSKAAPGNDSCRSATIQRNRIETRESTNTVDIRMSKIEHL